MPSRRRAFTLVELLVVVGMITLLIALLFPALARARDAAVSVQCANNLRQIVAAMTTYEVEFHSFPIEADPGYGVYTRPGDDFKWMVTWAGMLAERHYLGGADIHAGKGVLGPLACPAVDDYNRQSIWIDYQSHYGYNAYVFPVLYELRSGAKDWWDTHAFFGRRSRMANDSGRKILLTETWGQNSYADEHTSRVWRSDGGSSSVDYTATGIAIGCVIDLRHAGGRGVNVAYMAGNVEMVFPPKRLPNIGDPSDDHPFGWARFVYTE